jgi:predicted DNA-binding protein with PD1-like motif
MIEGRSGADWVIRLVDGERLAASLASLELDSGVILGGIGMVRDARLGYWNGTSYEEHRIAEAAELLSMQGNVAVSPEGRIVHCHLTLALRDGTVRGGHLIEATVTNTAEISLRVLRGVRLSRRIEKNGLLGLYPGAED